MKERRAKHKGVGDNRGTCGDPHPPVPARGPREPQVHTADTGTDRIGSLVPDRLPDAKIGLGLPILASGCNNREANIDANIDANTGTKTGTSVDTTANTSANASANAAGVMRIGVVWSVQGTRLHCGGALGLGQRGGQRNGTTDRDKG